jgi:tetratricopeptide (TPR) repeat protein
MRHAAAAIFTALLIAGCASTPAPTPVPEESASRAPESPLARMRAARTAVETSPGDPEAHYALGNAYFDLTRYADAARAYQDAIAQAPAHGKAYTNLGLSLRMMGHFEAALAAYDRALEIEPDEAVTLRNALVAARAAGDFGRQYDYVRRLAALQPDDPNAQAQLAQVLMRQGRHEEAIPVVKRLMTLEPGVAEDYYILGDCHYRLGDKESAEAQWLETLRYDKNHASALKALAVLYWEQANYERAWNIVTHCRNQGIALDQGFITRLQTDSGKLSPHTAL